MTDKDYKEKIKNFVLFKIDCTDKELDNYSGNLVIISSIVIFLIIVSLLIVLSV